MATRNRTLLFLQYRNSYARTQSTAPHFSAFSETEGLMESSNTVIEMTALPPKCMDTVADVEDRLEQVKDKIKELEAMHRKHLLPGFDDRSHDEQAIERLTMDITNELYRIKREVQSIRAASNSTTDDQNDLLARNVQTSLATKVQVVSSAFQKQQSNYLKKMRGQDQRAPDELGLDSDLSKEAAEFLLDDQAQVGLTESQMAVVMANTSLIDQREREVNQIARSIQQLAELFNDLQTLVIDQGTMLDRIDYNIERTNVQVQKAAVEIEHGARYQDKTRRRKLILLLILFILLLVVILVVKPKHRG